jgi:hypothetical protein
MTTGTTNHDKPFESGELIEFCDDQYEVLANHGNSGTVRELGLNGSKINPFYWSFGGEYCHRVVPTPAA